jgi:hypothetical protein
MNDERNTPADVAGLRRRAEDRLQEGADKDGADRERSSSSVRPVPERI